MSYFIFVCGMIVGFIAGLVFKNNEHHKILRDMKEDVDSFVDKADDVVKEKWQNLREKF